MAFETTAFILVMRSMSGIAAHNPCSFGDCQYPGRLSANELTIFRIAVDDMGNVVLILWELVDGPSVGIA